MSQNEEDFFDKQISGRIMLLVAEKGITPSHVMRDCNIPSATFYNCLNGKRGWNVQTLVKIADYFQIGLDYLIKGPQSGESGTRTVKNNVYQLEEELRHAKDEVRRLRNIITGITQVTAKVEAVKEKVHKRKK